LVVWAYEQLSSSIFNYAPFYACKNRAAPEAVSDEYAPFYMRKTDHFIASEQY
jgi:hypothetical protein